MPAENLHIRDNKSQIIKSVTDQFDSLLVAEGLHARTENCQPIAIRKTQKELLVSDLLDEVQIIEGIIPAKTIIFVPPNFNRHSMSIDTYQDHSLIVHHPQNPIEKEQHTHTIINQSIKHFSVHTNCKPTLKDSKARRIALLDKTSKMLLNDGFNKGVNRSISLFNHKITKAIVLIGLIGTVRGKTFSAQVVSTLRKRKDYLNDRKEFLESITPLVNGVSGESFLAVD